MGFFTKTREKGIKSVAKEKKKNVKTSEKVTNNKGLERKGSISTTSETKPAAQMGLNLSDNPWWVSDACFIVEGKKISAHKVVISARSKPLASLIEKSPNGMVEINDFSHYIFSQLIKWVYGGKFEVKESDSEELGRCASFYEVEDLKEICQQTVQTYLRRNAVNITENFDCQTTPQPFLTQITQPIYQDYQLSEDYQTPSTDSSSPYSEVFQTNIRYSDRNPARVYPLESVLKPLANIIQPITSGLQIISETYYHDSVMSNSDNTEEEEILDNEPTVFVTTQALLTTPEQMSQTEELEEEEIEENADDKGVHEMNEERHGTEKLSIENEKAVNRMAETKGREKTKKEKKDRTNSKIKEKEQAKSTKASLLVPDYQNSTRTCEKNASLSEDTMDDSEFDIPSVDFEIPSHSTFEIGLSAWSEDPILYVPDRRNEHFDDSARITEIF